MGLSQANPIRDLPEAFTDWGSLATLDLGSWSIPQQTLLLLACMAVGGWFFAKSCLGRWVTQIGENPTAARFSAVPVASVQFTIFALSGLTCGLGSVLQTARFATAHPAAATGLELEVIACVVIGGTRITGGSGSMLGTLLGLLILGLLRFGMDMTGVMQQHQIILIGALVVLTAIFNEWMARRGTRRKPAATLTPIPNLGGIA
jgi:ribose/xylose/arabinose/galactoside ABC-type transport system permease subunit